MGTLAEDRLQLVIALAMAQQDAAEKRRWANAYRDQPEDQAPIIDAANDAEARVTECIERLRDFDNRHPGVMEDEKVDRRPGVDAPRTQTESDDEMYARSEHLRFVCWDYAPEDRAATIRIRRLFMGM